MKKAKIVNAWDTMSPTGDQKQRMRSALEARLAAAAEAQPDVVPTEELQKPKYQSVQPARRRVNVPMLMAAALALVVAVSLFLRVLTGNRESPASFSAPIPQDLPDPYREKIQTYITAIEEDWNPVQCASGGVYYRLQDVDSLDALGYALRDIDGSGTQELLITDGDIIYDLYTLSSRGEIVPLAQSTEQDRVYLSGYGHIGKVTTVSEERTVYTYLALSSDRLRSVEELTRDGNGVQSPYVWHQGIKSEPITEEEAGEIMDSYYHWYISFTTFSGKEVERTGAEPDTLMMKRYAEKVARILKEEKITDFCFYDYDGDSRSELLLGTQDNVRYMLDQISDNKTVEITRQCDGENQGFFLCQDYVTAYWYENEQGLGCYYWSDLPNGDYLDDFRKVGEAWYSLAFTTNPKPISQEEAEAIQEKYPRLTLPWRDISQFPTALPESGEEYISTLFEEVYLPIAAEGKQITEADLKSALLEQGYMWSEEDGLLTCGDGDVMDAYLRVPMADASGCINGPLTYFLPGTVGRFVEVRWEDSGVQYRIGTDTYHNTYPVNTAQELKVFLNADKNSILALQTAEIYAEQYFAAAASDMRKEHNQDSSNKLYSWDLQYELVNLTGYENASDTYAQDGYVKVTATANLNQSPNSWEYLTMRLVKENGDWKVRSYLRQEASEIRISALLEDGFLSIASDGAQLTRGELVGKMEEKGFVCEIGGDIVMCWDPDISGADLGAVFTTEGDSGRIQLLNYVLPGEVCRLVQAQWEGGEIRYRASTDVDNRFSQGIWVDSVKELQDFLTADEESLQLLKTAEEFAFAYFIGSEDKMLEHMVSSQTSISDMFSGNRVTRIEKIIGLEDAEKRYAQDGFVTVSAAAYIDSPDSYTYLTMELVKENNQWRVRTYSLEK